MPMKALDIHVGAVYHGADPKNTREVVRIGPERQGLDYRVKSGKGPPGFRPLGDGTFAMGVAAFARWAHGRADLPQAPRWHEDDYGAKCPHCESSDVTTGVEQVMSCMACGGHYYCESGNVGEWRTRKATAEEAVARIAEIARVAALNREFDRVHKLGEAMDRIAAVYKETAALGTMTIDDAGRFACMTWPGRGMLTVWASGKVTAVDAMGVEGEVKPERLADAARDLFAMPPVAPDTSEPNLDVLAARLLLADSAAGNTGPRYVTLHAHPIAGEDYHDLGLCNGYGMSSEDMEAVQDSLSDTDLGDLPDDEAWVYVLCRVTRVDVETDGEGNVIHEAYDDLEVVATRTSAQLVGEEAER